MAADDEPRVSPETEAAIEPAAWNLVAMRDDLIEGADFYVRAVAGIEPPDRREVVAWLERFAEHGHRSDEFRILGIPEESGEEMISPEARRLHTALASSIALLLSSDEGSPRDDAQRRGAHGAHGDPRGGRPMGRLSRLTERFSQMSESEMAQVEAQSDLTTMLVSAAVGGALNYHELSPDGRELDADDRASALGQLETGAIAIVTAERERELVAGLAPDVPIGETLMLLRVMQQALILALSEDPALRARALDAYTVFMYGRLVEAPWKAYFASREG